MLKKIITAILLLGFSLFGAYYYFSYHYGVKNYETATADFTTTSEGLKAEFVKNETAATQKYQSKAMIVNGKITSIEGSTISFDGVDCIFTLAEKSLKIGDKVSLKGRLVGYDSLLEIVNLDQCSVVK